VEAGSSRYASIGSNEWTFVISLAAASHLGLEPTPVSGSSVMLLRAPHDLTGQEIERAKDIVARHIGAYAISARDLGSHDGPDRLWAIASGALLGLAILAVALALVRSESRRDQAILVAVGAEPRDRRRIAAAGALLLAFLGGALAVPVGFLPIAVIQSALTGDTPIVVPWGAIAAVLFAVPLLAGTVSAVTSRQPPVLDLLQPRT
jgi:putative ABC transport system permease protein